MGFISSADTINLTARLTPYGREQLLKSNSNIIDGFVVGDSDANYFTDLRLENGNIPSISGLIGANNTISNSTYFSINKFRSNVLTGDGFNFRKAIESNSREINTNIVSNGVKNLSGTTNMGFIKIDRNDLNDKFINLLYSFRFPITDTDKLLFDSIPASKNGFSDTALSELNQDDVLVIGIDNAEYGELLDGKQININITNSIGTFNLYSTFQKTNLNKSQLDGQYRETGRATSIFGDNIAYLFSDQIKRPNNDVTKSWSTGFNINRPFELRKKETFNFTANPQLNLNVDQVVGYVHLDKGFIVITDPSIVDNFTINTHASLTTLNYSHVSTVVSQNITCILNSGEFYRSQNKTWLQNQPIRISEIGIVDSNNNLIAIAKTNEHILKRINQVIALSINLIN
jgi:hypothetical protein